MFARTLLVTLVVCVIHLCQTSPIGGDDENNNGGVISKNGESRRREKRYTIQGSKWERTDLTYRISQYPSKPGLKKCDVEEEIGKAFKVWSQVTPLSFHLKKNGRVHIDIKFVKGEHGGSRFDEPRSALAHAFFPQYGGYIYFNDEGSWSINSYSGPSIFQVAVHYIGHALGLAHSRIQNAVMASNYDNFKTYNPDFSLHQDDISGIQALYGTQKEDCCENSTSEEHSFKPTVTQDRIPDLCQDSKIDAITKVSGGWTYVFKGEYYWLVERNRLADGYPKEISADWDGLPGNLDAALTWPDGRTFFFKGNKYWRFKNRQMYKGYPKSISFGFTGIPDSPDAAFVWGGNGKTYFFKGSEYWRFDSKSEPPVSKQYPKPIKHWAGLPNNIDGAFKWDNGKTYFFKDDRYYRFNDLNFEIDKDAVPKFPRNTAFWWFDCKNGKESTRTHSQPSPVLTWID